MKKKSTSSNLIGKIYKRQPFHRPCDVDSGGCGERFKPTGRTNRLCRECITKIRKQKKEERRLKGEKNGAE